MRCACDTRVSSPWVLLLTQLDSTSLASRWQQFVTSYRAGRVISRLIGPIGPRTARLAELHFTTVQLLERDPIGLAETRKLFQRVIESRKRHPRANGKHRKMDPLGGIGGNRP